MGKKLKTRTKLVYISILAVIALFLYSILCSIFGWEMPSDAFVVGWYAFFSTELAYIMNITIKGKKDDDN